MRNNVVPVVVSTLLEIVAGQTTAASIYSAVVSRSHVRAGRLPCSAELADRSGQLGPVLGKLVGQPGAP